MSKLPVASAQSSTASPEPVRGVTPPANSSAGTSRGTSGPAGARTGDKPPRLVSLDAYRGLIMLTLAASGFGLAAVAAKFPDSRFWQIVHYQFEHPEWLSHVPRFGIVCSYWDLIQPSFMFMVGVAMPFSYARRTADGESLLRQAGHAALRSLILILMGVFLSSAWSKETNWTFVNVLTQIGLGYFFLFCMLRWPTWAQLLAAATILIGYWWFFVRFEVPGATSYADYFVKNTNAASHFDLWLLNQFPRPEPFTENSGGYATLNFIPSIVTMLFGVMAGQLLRGERAPQRKFVILLAAGAISMTLGLIAGYTVCPIVKRIWTPSWTLFSGAYTLWILAAFYGVVDLKGYRRWVFPLVVFGVNSMLVYWMGQLLRRWTADQIKIHFGSLPWPSSAAATTLREYMADGTYGPIVQSLAVTLVFWLVCLWLYRQKVFLRV